jgi:DNA helicase-2/ATP-dependent DNA helicase PcrA
MKSKAIIAGAGAGKTRRIIETVRALPEEERLNTAIITYTRKAADELKSRLDYRVGFVGTLHALSFSLLAVNRNHRLTLIPEFEVHEIIKRKAQDLGIRINMSSIISAYQKFDPFADMAEIIESGTVHRLISSYYFDLWEKSLTDFKGILFETRKYLNNPANGLGFQHIFVDESQDCNRSDFEIFLNSKAETLTMVCDPRQAIYAFRGSDSDAVESFLSTAEIERMDINYRSKSVIVQFANDLIKSQSVRPMKSVKAGGSIELLKKVKLRGKSVEVLISDNIERWLKQNPEFDSTDIAVLCRTNFQVSMVESSLKDAGIPVETKTFQTDRPIDWKTLCLFIATLPIEDGNPIIEDMISRHTNFDWLKLDKTKYIEMKGGQKVITRVKLLRLLAAMKFSQGSIHALKNQLGNELYELQELILQMNQVNFETDAIEEIYGVKVITVHKSKGLEFERVYIYEPTEGLYPMTREDESESQRILYVAATRAIGSLVLAWNDTVKNLTRFIKV